MKLRSNSFGERLQCGADRASGFDFPLLWVDNLKIVDSDDSPIGSYLIGQIPRPGEIGVLPDQTIEVAIVDGPMAPVEQTSIVLKLDGAPVAPAITRSGVITKLVYTPPGWFPSGSDHKLALTYRAGGTEYVFDWGFRVVSFPVSTPDLNVKPRTDKPGFIWRVSQIDLPYELWNSNQRAEDQLAGLLRGDDGQPVPNSANPQAVGVARACW